MTTPTVKPVCSQCMLPCRTDAGGRSACCAGEIAEVQVEAALNVAGSWPVEAAQYHADHTAIGHSMLEVFRESVPLYHGRFVARTVPAPEPTAAMALGTALHAALLEPERFCDLVAVAPLVDRRTKAGRERWDQFEAEASGRTVISGDQELLARVMANAVRRNKFAAQLLAAPGRNEATFRVRDDATGLELKARQDRLLDRGIILDLKTAADPSPEAFGRSAHNFGYYRQDAHYRRVRQLALGIDRHAEEMLFIVVGSSPPHECFVFELDERAQELGWMQVEDDLQALANRQLTGNWESPYDHQLNTLQLPRWAYTEQRS